MDHGGSRYHGDDQQGVPLTDGTIATSDALKRKEGEHEQMLVPDERHTVAYEQGAFCCVNDVTPAR